jgi:hypothetical protein
VEALQARGALAPDEAAQLLTLTDPAQRKMAVDAYRTPTEAKPELVEYVNAEGKTVKGWKVPTVGEEYVQPSDAENDFTLSAGQIRFGPQGQVIARGPAPQGPQPSYQWAVPPGATTPRLMTPQEIRASGATSVAAAGEAGGVKLTGAQQEDMATMLTVEELIGGVEAIHKEKGGLPGVGPLEGRFFPSQRGSGGPTGETVRNMVGNIQGTIAKLRGGTAFSESEKAMLDSYTPTLTDTDAAIRTKLVNLRDFIQKKRTNTIRVASGQYTLPSTPPATTTTPTTGGAGLGMSYDDYKKRGGR